MWKLEGSASIRGSSEVGSERLVGEKASRMTRHESRDQKSLSPMEARGQRQKQTRTAPQARLKNPPGDIGFELG
jgi:hypothetical protein